MTTTMIMLVNLPAPQHLCLPAPTIVVRTTHKLYAVWMIPTMTKMMSSLSKQCHLPKCCLLKDDEADGDGYDRYNHDAVDDDENDVLALKRWWA